MYISEQQPNLGGLPAGDEWEVARVEHNRVPTVEEARTSDFILLVGQFGNITWAGQFAGLLGRVLPEVPTLIVAFPVTIEAPLGLLLDRLGVRFGGVAQPTDVDTVHPAFAEYFALFGQSAVQFQGTEEAETLGQIPVAGVDQPLPAAISVPRDRGAIYTLPFIFAGAEGEFGRMLFDAITAHQADAGGVLPEFLADLHLPGEHR